MFFELFADTGAKERGPELGPFLTKLSPCGGRSRLLSVGAIFLLRVGAIFMVRVRAIFRVGAISWERPAEMHLGGSYPHLYSSSSSSLLSLQVLEGL